MPDARSHPQPCVQWKKARKQVTTGTPKRSGIPCTMVYGLWRALLGEPGFVATVAPRYPRVAPAGPTSRFAELDPSVGGSGPHAFAVRLKLHSSGEAKASIASRS